MSKGKCIKTVISIDLFVVLFFNFCYNMLVSQIDKNRIRALYCVGTGYAICLKLNMVLVLFYCYKLK